MAEYLDKAGLKVVLNKLKSYIDNKATGGGSTTVTDAEFNATSFHYVDTNTRYYTFSSGKLSAFFLNTLMYATTFNLFKYSANDNGDESVDGFWYTSNSLTNHVPSSKTEANGIYLYFGEAETGTPTIYESEWYIIENGKLLGSIIAQEVYDMGTNSFYVGYLEVNKSNDVYTGNALNYSNDILDNTIYDLFNNPTDYELSLE